MELEAFEKKGFVGPLDALSPPEMESIKLEIERELLQAKQAQKLSISIIRNRHLNWDVAAKLCSHPAIVATATKLLGPDLILWRSNIFPIPKGIRVAWHRNEHLKLLSDNSQQISVDLALSETSEDKCVCLLPGTHKMTPLELIKIGLKIDEESDNKSSGSPTYFRASELSIEPVKMVLKPGQYFVFHPSLLHTSFERTTESFKGDNDQTDFTRWQPHLSNFCSPYPGRLVLGLRITVPSVRVLPAAFKETLPRIDKCVLLSGTDKTGVNELGDWAPELINQPSR